MVAYEEDDSYLEDADEDALRAYAFEFFDVELEADHEEQESGSDLDDGVDHACVAHEVECVGSDEGADKQESEENGLFETGGDDGCDQGEEAYGEDGDELVLHCVCPLVLTSWTTIVTVSCVVIYVYLYI